MAKIKEVRGPTRMLPVVGDRRDDCALMSDCLGELWRAVAPRVLGDASCPSTCTSFRPVRADASEYTRGLGSWAPFEEHAPEEEKRPARHVERERDEQGRYRRERNCP